MTEFRGTGILKNFISWAPLFLSPIFVIQYKNDLTPWIFMWVLSFSIYMSLKWLSFSDQVMWKKPLFLRSMGYLFLWPGMDARSFFSESGKITKPDLKEWGVAILKTVFGILIFFLLPPLVYPEHPILSGWLSMVGIVMVLHFGIFHLLSASWRSRGINARQIMDSPLRSWSLGNFWGQRWNLAFRDLADCYVFKKSVRTLGVAGASLSVFAVSGLVHDFVISYPSDGGWGLPMLYFLIQGFGVIFERSKMGKRLLPGKYFKGYFFTYLVLIIPLPLLFHSCFIKNIIIPMQFSVNPVFNGY